MPLYRFDDFELDVGLYRLSRAGEPVAIGPKPFDLLLYLIRHARRTIPKAELIREVWQAEAVSDSSIPTCMTAVRRALDDDPDNPRFIQTVRGRGYRFIGSAVSEPETRTDSDRQTVAASRSKTFVGRQAEMASLSAGLSQALGGDPQTYLLLGEAGMGKTRLIEEFTHRATAAGAAVLVGRCREEEGAPAFWPWIQILRTHIESGCQEMLSSLELHAAVISQMLPELRKLFPTIAPLPAVDAEQARFRLLDAITRFFQASAKQKPLVLMIDDLHRADTSSLLLLEFLVRDLRSSHVFILGAYRDLDILGDTTREQCLTRVARTATTRSIQLKGISRRAVGELVGQPEDAELVSALYDQSAGNPFFLTQLVQLLEVDSTELSDKSADEWRFSLPTGVRDAISSQLSGLPARTHEALTVAAVIGRDFTPALLARGLGAPISEILEQLEPAVTARLIEDSQHRPGSYRFSHALLRDVVYDQIPKLDRGRHHKQIGEALEALHVSDLDNCIAELAFHFAESAGVGDAGKAIAYCIAAGEQAASRLAHENASEHFRSALRLMDFQDIADPRKRCELLIQLGAAEMRIGEREAARQNLLHAANIARQIDAPELLARAALGLAPGFFTIEVGTYDAELESLLNEARSAMPKMQSDLLVQLTARLAMAAVWSNTTESCDELSETALTLAHDVQNLVTKAYALRARHGALWGPERFEERRQLISELGELSRASGDAEIALMYRILNITALLEAGDISVADREIRAYTKLSETLQLPHAEWYVSLFGAMRALMEGRYSDAASSAQHFLEIGNRVHDQNAPQSFGAHLLLRLWEENRLAEISALVEEFITKHPMIPAWKCAALFIHSEIKNPEAIQLFDEFSEFGFDNLPLNETWAISVQMLSNACLNIGCDSSADQLYKLSLPGKMHHTIVGYGVMSWGSRARELGNLASLMGRFEDAGEHFELAIAQNRKTGAAPWVAHSQFDYAKMLARQRDPTHKGRIRELAADAQQTAQRLGMERLKLQIAEFVRQK
jgi:DNA-binding winged helix-turn-helix (wHTH) protein/tetratricopeptide (TPR) repeat protein